MAFNEKYLAEDYIIEQLKEKGWRFVSPDALDRESYEEPLLIPTLVRVLERINKESGIGDEEINKVLNELKLTGTGIEGVVYSLKTGLLLWQGSIRVDIILYVNGIPLVNIECKNPTSLTESWHNA